MYAKMKVRRFYLFLFSVVPVFCALFTSCERPEPDQSPSAQFIVGDGPIPHSVVTLDPMECGWNDTLLLHDNRVILVNDALTFQNYVDCNCGYYPSIDFDRYSVIIWSGGISGGAFYSANFECTNGVVCLHLFFTESLTLGPTEFYVKIFLLPKIPDHTPVSLNIQTDF